MHFEKAKGAFQKVLSLNANNLEALSTLGELWSWDAARRDDAISLLKHAYDLNPSDAAVAKKLSEALFWQGNAMDALRYASPIANKYHADKKFMTEYAQMLSQTGHADQALELYNTVLKDESNRNLALKLDSARALYKSGQKQKAQALYADVSQAVQGTAIARDVDFIKAMAGLAFDLDLYADALKWDQLLPDSIQRQKDVQLRAARALTRVYRMPEAVERFQRLYEAGLLSADEKLEYAEYLRQLHLEPEAMPAPNLIENLYKEAMLEAPNNAEVSVRLARYYAEEENRFAETVQAYQQALSNERLGDRISVQKELLNYIKTDKTRSTEVNALFQQMLAESPDDLTIKTAYAEFLSWQNDRRPEALKAYVELGKEDPENAELWESRIEEVLKWHQPTTDLIPVYQSVVDLYPQNKAIWLTVARAYAKDKHYYKEAVETYGILVKRYADDSTIKREWLGLMLSNAYQRNNNIALLKKMTQDDPSDLDVLATYGKLLSYDRKYGPAMNAFEEVLRQNAEHRDALVGKGYIILWSGRKFEAKEFFTDLRHKYPDDVDIAIGLAQTEKLIGRYDAALRIIQEIKPLMQNTPATGAPASNASDGSSALPVDYRLVDNRSVGNDSINRRAVYDFSILPYADESADGPDSADIVSDNAFAEPDSADFPVNVMPTQSPQVVQPSAKAKDLRSLQSDVEILNEAVNSLKLLQQSSRSQLDQIYNTVKTTRDAVPGALDLQSDADAIAGQPGMMPMGKSVGEGGMTRAYGTYAALDYDTNPLLSGLGRFRNDELEDLERGLSNDLRPMLRGGFTYSTQEGESTTTSMNSWGIPNQISLSLTPQMRVRGGVRPTKYFLPRGVSPDSSWGLEYMLGGTVKYWDRLTLDGDFAITHFDQSRSENFTFQAQAQYDFSDSIRAKLGLRRIPQYNSLLSVAGQKPNQGAFARELVGQARENTAYLELNTHPFSQNVDWNLGYEWGFVEGEKIPTNYKNQAFTSLGYTWHYAAHHEMRLGYEFLYFGYGKNATNGYFDTTAAGNTQPVVSLRPLALAHNGYVFGGYFSPKTFILNSGRLDLRGSLFNKFLEYKMGGSIGGQVVRLGHNIDDDEKSGSGLALSFDSNLIMNLTDWFALYGNIDYLDAGQRFNRWRFGGGVIIRPHIDALSPLVGRPSEPLQAKEQ